MELPTPGAPSRSQLISEGMPAMRYGMVLLIIFGIVAIIIASPFVIAALTLANL